MFTSKDSEICSLLSALGLVGLLVRLMILIFDGSWGCEVKQDTDVS